MIRAERDAVTGAFSYTGKYIARQLVASGRQVITLTNHPDRESELASQVQAFLYHFEDPRELIESLKGIDTLYNTYWVRFPYGKMTFGQAVANTRILVECARQAGVRRIVHISVSNPSLESRLPYFHGKAQAEEAVQGSGLSYAILRPTLIFALEDILINNIAYLLRRYPFFPIPGSGDYSLQPIFAGDVAELAIAAGEGSANLLQDARGAEIYTFDELVRAIARQTGSKSRIVHLPVRAALWLSQIVGLLVRDVVLTHDELAGLMAGLLVSKQPPTGSTAFSTWLAENAAQLGQSYAPELERHYRSMP